MDEGEEYMTVPNPIKVEDLLSYLANQEKRIQDLEQENEELSEKNKKYIHKDEFYKELSNNIPSTGLFSQNFYKRAFSVWGHFFIAQLIIGIILGFVYLIIFEILKLFS
jgi:hypothetical protein